MKLLFIGDIFGRPGRDLVRHGLEALVARHGVDFVIANGENAAGGNGLTREIGEQLLDQGVDVITSGNHIWDKKEVYEYLGVEARVLRPANYPDAPGRGSFVARARNGRSVGVLNLMGRVHMANLDDPFRLAEREVAAMSGRTRVILVDFHAEVTSEKLAMGWFLDGKVTAVMRAGHPRIRRSTPARCRDHRTRRDRTGDAHRANQLLDGRPGLALLDALG